MYTENVSHQEAQVRQISNQVASSMRPENKSQLRADYTGHKDRYGQAISVGKMIKKYDGEDFVTGMVVYANCAYRIQITKGYNGDAVKGKDLLKYNHTLIYDEIVGTSHIEVIK